MEKILVTGTSGRLGSVFTEHLETFLPENVEVYLLQNRKPVDARNINGKLARVITSLEEGGVYDVAFHFAANLHTSKGNPKKNPENLPEFTRDNVELTQKVCQRAGYVVYASTDNVFSGMDERDYLESDKTNPPNNFYGQTKAEAEKIVLDRKGAVVRFQSPLGVRTNLIVDRIFDALEGRPTWPFWNDQVVRPTFYDDVILASGRIYGKPSNQVFHVSCSGEPLSRAGIAKKVLEIYRQYDIPIAKDSIEEEPCNDPDFPRRLVLSTAHTRGYLGIPEFTSVDDAIRLHVLRIKKPEAI